MKSIYPVSSALLLIIGLLISTIAFAQKVAPTNLQRDPFSIGETLRFQSDILQEERTLNIYLPLQYQADSPKEYPIIYLLDGSADEDFIHIAGLVQFGSFPWIDMMPESIVVGISNIDRKRDFTYPTRNKKDKKDFPTTGGSAAFIDFLEKELQPIIEARYRTNDTTALIGQSLGGLVATEILFKRPNLFDNYIIVSPSLWWDDESLLAREPSSLKEQKSVFIAVGKEGPVMERVANELYEKLNALPNYSARLGFEYFPEQDHGDVLHLAAYSALGWLFNKE